MAGAIRYRQGLNEQTLQPLVGIEHLYQSLNRIWATRPNTRVQRLSFGADLRSFLAEDLTPVIALSIYNELVASAARDEPEAEITQVQLVSLKESGVLGLKHAGTYYPEGRFGNYRLSIPYGSSASPLGGRS